MRTSACASAISLSPVQFHALLRPLPKFALCLIPSKLMLFPISGIWNERRLLHHTLRNHEPHVILLSRAGNATGMLDYVWGDSGDSKSEADRVLQNGCQYR